MFGETNRSSGGIVPTAPVRDLGDAALKIEEPEWGPHDNGPAAPVVRGRPDCDGPTITCLRGMTVGGGRAVQLASDPSIAPEASILGFSGQSVIQSGRVERDPPVPTVDPTFPGRAKPPNIGGAETGAKGEAKKAVSQPTPVHPLGTRAKILLTSVFGPYARDDEYGSRSVNPMELYQNQVTRAEGPFSLRMFHRSWGIMLIQTNISAPCTLLDFPTLDRFIDELRNHEYDVVGISSILPNVEKVKKMCDLIREHQPHATIVVGGHVANRPGLQTYVAADHIVRGEGVHWFRRYLGEDVTQPIRHPLISSAIGTRTMGVTVRNSRQDVAATLLSSVGCPMGCNFCTTSAMFGGKGKFINFYETGDELFDVMCGIEKGMGVRSFFVMDENFLLHRKRALRLLELMEEHEKSWSLYVFSSAHAVKSYTIEQLVRLGISWVWMGLEGKKSQYAKLQGIDTHALVRTLQSHGIRVLGSSIIGLEEHTPDNIRDVIEHAVAHRSDFHQFMLYTPMPGTPLYAEHLADRTLLDPSEYHEGDIHGQTKFRHRHPHIKGGQETEMVLNAFRRDFEVNGPSVLRIARTVLAGWKRYKHHADPRVRDRFAWEARELKVTFPATLWAARRWFRRQNPTLAQDLSRLLKDIKREIGIKARLAAPFAGRIVSSALRREDKRLKNAWTYEPPTFYEVNEGAWRDWPDPTSRPELIRWVTVPGATGYRVV